MVECIQHVETKINGSHKIMILFCIGCLRILIFLFHLNYLTLIFYNKLIYYFKLLILKFINIYIIYIDICFILYGYIKKISQTNFPIIIPTNSYLNFYTFKLSSKLF